MKKVGWRKVQSYFFAGAYKPLKRAVMLPQYYGEDSLSQSTPVKYFTQQERSNTQIILKDGLFYDQQGKLVNTINSDAIGQYAYSFLYVVDLDYNFYVIGKEFGDTLATNHSSVLAGKPVKCAGYLCIVDGKLKSISNASGHYQPSEDALIELIAQLHRNGIPRDSYEVKFQGTRSLRLISYATAEKFITEFPFRAADGDENRPVTPQLIK